MNVSTIGNVVHNVSFNRDKNGKKRKEKGRKKKSGNTRDSEGNRSDQAGWHVHVYNWRSFATKNRICPAGISFLLGGADYKAPVQ
jgi:hypothetical protein